MLPCGGKLKTSFFSVRYVALLLESSIVLSLIPGYFSAALVDCCTLENRGES